MPNAAAHRDAPASAAAEAARDDDDDDGEPDWVKSFAAADHDSPARPATGPGPGRKGFRPKRPRPAQLGDGPPLSKQFKAPDPPAALPGEDASSGEDREFLPAEWDSDDEQVRAPRFAYNPTPARLLR